LPAIGGEEVTGAEDQPDGCRRWSNWRLVGPLVAGVLFFCVLTPLGLVVRLAGRDPLRLCFDRRAPSYWLVRGAAGGRQTSMKKQS
jgi:hypothetical protein